MQAQNIKDMAGKYDSEFVGEVPYDTVVTRAQMVGLSVVEFEEGPVTSAMKNIWLAMEKKLS